MYEPSFDTFAASLETPQASLVSARLVADLETPVSAFLKLSAGRAGNIFLLESVEGGATRGRYSMIGLDPDVIWRVNGSTAEINRHALVDAARFTPCGTAPLDALRELIAESAIQTPADLPPMAALTPPVEHSTARDAGAWTFAFDATTEVSTPTYIPRLISKVFGRLFINRRSISLRRASSLAALSDMYRAGAPNIPDRQKTSLRCPRRMSFCSPL